MTLFRKSLFAAFIFLFSASCYSEENLITKKGVGSILIGEDYADFINIYNKKYEVVHKEGSLGDYKAGVYIYDKGELLILVGNKNWGMPPYVVKMIEIYSDKFKTKENVHAGMDTKELLKIFPEMKVQQDFENGGLVFLPEKYQTDKILFWGKQIVFMIKLEFENEDVKIKEGEIPDVNYINENLSSLNGRVKSIKIFDYN